MEAGCADSSHADACVYVVGRDVDGKSTRQRMQSREGMMHCTCSADAASTPTFTPVPLRHTEQGQGLWVEALNSMTV